MNFWELEIVEPGDLNVLGDLLEDAGHPGVKTVRWMIEHKRWPGYTSKIRSGMVGCPHGWFWRIITQGDWMPTERCRLSPWFILTGRNMAYYHSITEAIWAVINADLYRRQPL